MMKTKGQGFIIGIILFLILIVGLFELGLLIYAYVHADEVKCNLLWCEFKTTKQYYFTESNSTCYYNVNGTQINCSDESMFNSSFWKDVGQYLNDYGEKQ